MIQQSYIWEQFSDNINCVPFYKNTSAYCIGFLKIKGYISINLLKLLLLLLLCYFFIAKLQMFMFGLTCFKAILFFPFNF